jgi:hypothetical protein
MNTICYVLLLLAVAYRTRSLCKFIALQEKSTKKNHTFGKMIIRIINLIYLKYPLKQNAATSYFSSLSLSIPLFSLEAAQRIYAQLALRLIDVSSSQ